MENIDSDLLRTFIAIYECNGFSSASELLNKTQSTISQRLTKLEDMVGCPLINRTSRNIELTAAGKDFLIYSRRILKLHSDAINIARSKKSVALRLGIPDDYAQRYLPQALRTLKEQYPECVPEVVCENSINLIEKTLKGELDFSLCIKHENMPSGQLVCNEKLVWAASPKFNLSDHEILPLSLYPEGCAFRANAIKALAKNSIPWKVVFTSQSPGGIYISVNSGDSITITSTKLIPNDWVILESNALPDLNTSELMLYFSPLLNNHYAKLLSYEIENSITN